MDGGIGAATAAIGEAAATGAETIGKVASVAETTAEGIGSLESVTGPEVAEPILQDAMQYGTDDAFKHLAEINLEESVSLADLPQSEVSEDKTIPFPEKDEAMPVAEIAAEEEENEKVDTDSEEIPMEPGKIVDLTEYKNKRKKDVPEEEAEHEKEIEEEDEEEKDRKKTLEFLAENPDVLDALKNIDTLTKEQRDRVIKKIKEAIQEEKEGKKMSFLEMLLAIFVGEVVDVFEEESKNMSRSAA